MGPISERADRFVRSIITKRKGGGMKLDEGQQKAKDSRAERLMELRRRAVQRRKGY